MRRVLLSCLLTAGCGVRVASVGAEAFADAGDAQPPTGPAAPTADAGSTGTACRAPPVGFTSLDPTAWSVAGDDPADYTIDRDSEWPHSTASAHLLAKAASPSGFGTLMGTRSAAPFVGKKVRLSGSVKAASVTGWSGLWLRVDASGHQLALDNMQSRPITGTRDWVKYEVVLDVGAGATDLAFGLLLDGPGEVWAGDLALEEVSPGSPYVPDLAGWYISGEDPGEYTIGIDSETPLCGRGTGTLRASVARPASFATYMKTIAANDLRGRRARFRASVKVSAVTGKAGLWMRVDDDAGITSVIDNMSKRPITGTADFAQYDVVLDVAPNAGQVAFGLLLYGPGQAWIGDAVIEEVGTDVPTTN